MTKFLKGSDLNAALEKIISDSESSLILVSPYIKLHNRIKNELKSKRNNANLKISVVYGKSENNVNRLLPDDLAFFKEFPNVEIRYEKDLHAKYYGNDFSGLITSMNLYDFSQNHNIEAGVLIEASNRVVSELNSIVGKSDVDYDANTYFREVIKNSELLYHKVPKFETTMFGLSQKYIESKVEIDIIDHFHERKADPFTGYKSYEKKLSINSKNDNETALGFCIRTGVEIPFNVQKPYCDKAYNSWSKWSNQDYQEKYCHFTGETSDGNTCYATPILRKNWREAKQKHGF